jgi:hypothetical protein
VGLFFAQNQTVIGVISVISIIGFMISGLAFLLASLTTPEADPRTDDGRQRLATVALWSMIFFLLLELFLS